MEENIQIFNNEQFSTAMSEQGILTIQGIRCYEKDGVVYLNLEDVANGLGFTQTQNKNGVEYTSIRWERIEGYFAEFGFPHKWGKNDYIPENIFYRLCMKGKNEAAEAFQAKVADEVIPAIRKAGSYSVIAYSYMIADPIKRAERWVEEQKEKIALSEENAKLQYEVEYKEDVIIGLVEDIDLASKRQRITQIIRHGANRNGENISNRYELLYHEFEMKYHLDLKRRLSSGTYKDMKPKIKSKMDLIDRGMNMIPELYEVACKLFENDFEELKKEWESTITE